MLRDPAGLREAEAPLLALPVSVGLRVALEQLVPLPSLPSVLAEGLGVEAAPPPPPPPPPSQEAVGAPGLALTVQLPALPPAAVALGRRVAVAQLLPAPPVLLWGLLLGVPAKEALAAALALALGLALLLALALPEGLGASEKVRVGVPGGLPEAEPLLLPMPPLPVAELLSACVKLLLPLPRAVAVGVRVPLVHAQLVGVALGLQLPPDDPLAALLALTVGLLLPLPLPVAQGRALPLLPALLLPALLLLPVPLPVALPLGVEELGGVALLLELSSALALGGAEAEALAESTEEALAHSEAAVEAVGRGDAEGL